MNKKNPSSRYFNGRSVRSTQRGKIQFRLNVLRPSFQSHSESVPTGQIQLQNPRRSSSEIKRNAASRTIAAG